MTHFDTILLIASFVVPFLLAVQLFTDKRKSLSRSIMSHIQLISAIIFLLLYFYFIEDYRLYVPFHSLHAMLEFSIFPLLYIYVKSVVKPGFNLRKKLVHLIPAFIVLITGSYLFYIHYSFDELQYFLTNNRRGEVFDSRFNLLIISRYISLAAIAVQAVAYSFAFFKLPAEYNEKLKREFANIENFSIDWINTYLVSCGVVTAVGIGIYALVPIEGLQQHLIVVIFAGFSAYMVRLGVLALRQESSPSVLNEDEADKTAEVEKIMDPKLQELLTFHMEEKKVFLQPDINLTILAKSLGTNRTYLSAFINQQFGKNFNSYINDYRIEYVKKILAEDPSISKESLCQAAGFGSCSTLQRALKKVKA